MSRRKGENSYKRHWQTQRRTKQIFIIFVGILFVVAGLIMYAYPDLSQPLKETKNQIAAEYGPIVRVACNKPNQEMHVTMITDMTGKTDLAFQRIGNERDDVTVWIIIDDDYAPFTWSTMKNATAVQMQTLDRHTYFSESTDLVYGTGTHAELRMDFGKNAGIVHTIMLESELADYIVKDQGKCRLRVPSVGLWYGKSVTIDRDLDMEPDDPKWIDKTMDGEDLYYLDMQINATVHNPAVKNADLVLKSISPRGRESDIGFEWQSSEFFLAQIHYIDEEWDRKIALLEVLSSVFFGMGLSSVYFVAAKQKEDEQ